MSFADIPIELVITPEHDRNAFRADWPDGISVSDLFLRHVPEVWLDLMPFMAARILLMHGLDAERDYIVRLQGSDRDLMRSTLGAAAATPSVNTAAPVWETTRCIYRLPARRRFLERRRKAADR